MKHIVIVLALLAVCGQAVAQDIIVMRSEKKVTAKILEITPSTISYLEWDNQDGPKYTVNISDIASIIFANGKVQVFEAAPAQVVRQATIQSIGKADEPVLMPLKLEGPTMWKAAKADGRKITRKEFIVYAEQDADADMKASIQKFKNKNTTENIVAYSLLGLVTIGNIMHLSDDLEESYSLNALQIIGIGGCVIMLFDPLGIKSQGIKVSDMYNGRRKTTTLNTKPSSTLMFGFTSSGVGFSYRF